MKRLVIILSLVAVFLAGTATVVIILRARAVRPAVPGVGVPAPVTETGAKPTPVPVTPATSKPNGIVPVERDSPPVLSEAAQKDGDNDGLVDGEEAMLGTDPKRKDTDNDGLSDLDEARSFCTDPLKAMTDGKTQDKTWVATRQQEASAAGQRPVFCVE
jgi:hypothetical protein